MASRGLFPLEGRCIFVAGHRGMVGSALVRRLEQQDCRILTVARDAVDLRDQLAVDRWFDEHRPEAVLLAAARVGGIHDNETHPGDFLYDNLAIATNVIEAARRTGVAKLMFLGSSCIYPRLAPQPMPETCLLSGSLEPTNEWYAIAKIAGLKLCQAYRRQHGCDFVSVMPTNLYGPNDNFDLLAGHVLPTLLAKIDAAVREGRGTVEIWGSGRPRREFLHVDDLADAVVFLMKLGQRTSRPTSEQARMSQSPSLLGRLPMSSVSPDSLSTTTQSRTEPHASSSTFLN